MIRTIIGIVVLIAAVLWLPVWLQVALFVLAILLLRYRFFILIPAIISDALYAPTARFSVVNHWMTLLVLALLGLHWLMTRALRTRTV